MERLHNTNDFKYNFLTRFFFDQLPIGKLARAESTLVVKNDKAYIAKDNSMDWLRPHRAARNWWA
jgi:hypothetical protein